MNNVQIAVLLTQYSRALDEATDVVGKSIPEHRVSSSEWLGREQEMFPVLEPVYKVLRNMQADIDTLGHPILMVEETPELEQPSEPEPAKGKVKEVITFEQDHICVNGVNLGVHDLLMFARTCLKREARNNGYVADMVVSLNTLIETNQQIRGDYVDARMSVLENGKEVK